MSKQSDAKEKQGYVAKPTPEACRNCKHFKMESQILSDIQGRWTRETNLRCGIGGFKVAKMGVCNEWEPKV